MEQRAGEKRRATRRRPGAERLLEAASELFYREGIGAVGVDTVSERAGVSKRTLYNRFEGKDGLIAEYLRRRDEGWKTYLRDALEGLEEPTERLLAVFEAYEEWLVGEDFRGCAFANAAAEIPDPDHPARVVARRHKEGVRDHLEALAEEAGFDDPLTLAERLLLLLEGAAATAAMRRSREPLGAAISLARELLDARPRGGAARRPMGSVPGRPDGGRSDRPRTSRGPRMVSCLEEHIDEVEEARARYDAGAR